MFKCLVTVIGHEMEKTGKFKIMFAKYVGKTEGKTYLGRLGRRGNCDIKMDVKGVGFGDWMELF
jgi:hypothetical protein